MYMWFVGDSVSRGGVTKLSKYMPLEAVVPEHELSASDPPIFATAHCLVARIPETQSLYYEANPANNKKVCARTMTQTALGQLLLVSCLIALKSTDMGFSFSIQHAHAIQVEANASGGFTEVGSGDPVERMQRRYILTASVIDFTKEAAVNVFNEQAAAMLGKSADQLHEIKVRHAASLTIRGTSGNRARWCPRIILTCSIVSVGP